MKEGFAKFVVPFAQVMYKPGLAITFVVATLSVVRSGGVEISAAWLLIDCILCVIISCASPAVPGGSTASITILFVQLGLPIEDIAAIIAINLFLDFFHTATNVFGDHCLAAVAAKKLDVPGKQ